MRDGKDRLRIERATLQRKLREQERNNPNSKFSKTRAASKSARKARKKNRK